MLPYVHPFGAVIYPAAYVSPPMISFAGILWAEEGLATVNGTTARACLKILLYHNLLVAFAPRYLAHPPARDHVMVIGSSTLTLADLTIRKPSHRTLDLGTGCGFYAFLASPHSAHVTGTDINSRAVNIASFNGLLNDLSNIAFPEGNLSEPVSDITFDLIATNPPFVISPEKCYTYCDGGMDGDGILQQIVDKVPEGVSTSG